MQLREWQQRFQNVVLGNDDFDMLPLQKKGLPRELSMEIYANAYRERLHSALRENYRALHQLLGDQDFGELAYSYTTAYPPITASIRWFGAELCDYLAANAPYSACPIFAELARFEWALRHSLDAADATRIDANYLQSLAAEQWETFICAVHPSLIILHGAWNAPQVWRALNTDEEPPQPAHFDSYWFIYRDADLMTQWRSADVYEAQAIQLWSHGENFGAICEFLVEKIGAGEAAQPSESAIEMAAVFMRTWIAQGLLIHPNDKAGTGEK
jgi:hypothetical protein